MWFDYSVCRARECVCVAYTSPHFPTNALRRVFEPSAAPPPAVLAMPLGARVGERGEGFLRRWRRGIFSPLTLRGVAGKSGRPKKREHSKNKGLGAAPKKWVET